MGINAKIAPDSVVRLVTYITSTQTPFPDRKRRRWRIPGTLTELSHGSGVPPATLNRALAWLRQRGMVIGDAPTPGVPGRRYLVLSGQPFVMLERTVAGLSVPALRVLAAVAHHRIGEQGEVGFCDYDRTKLAELTGLHPRTVSAAVAELVEAGHLAREDRVKRGAPWRLIPLAAQPLPHPPTPQVAAYLRSLKRSAFGAPNDPGPDLAKRPAPTRVRRAPASNDLPTPKGVGENEGAGVLSQPKACVRTGPEPAALRAADVSAVVAELPEPLRGRLPAHIPRRLIAAIARELQSRTALDLIARITRRWWGGGYATDGVRDPVAVLHSLVAARCADTRCEDGRIADAEGFTLPCRTCEVWPDDEQRADGPERPAQPRWGLPAVDWRAERRDARPRPAGLDWRAFRPALA